MRSRQTPVRRTGRSFGAYSDDATELEMLVRWRRECEAHLADLWRCGAPLGSADPGDGGKRLMADAVEHHSGCSSSAGWLT